MTEAEVFSRLNQLLKEGQQVVLCTLIEKKGSGPQREGAKMLVDGEGESVGTVGGGGLERRVVEEALIVLERGRPATLNFALGVEPVEGAIPLESSCGGEVKIFFDVIKPDPKLVVVGSGHVGKPLADIAHAVGFEVVVIDDAETASKERFPHALKVRSGVSEEGLKRIEVKLTDMVAIVHGETSYELSALRNFIPQNPSYLGLLGSRKKVADYKEQLKKEGFSEEELGKIRSPIGLDIGAETPEEIAVSIVAELIESRRRV